MLPLVREITSTTMKCWNGSRFHSIPNTRQDQIYAKCSCLKKGVSIKEESVEDGREMREKGGLGGEECKEFGGSSSLICLTGH